MASKPDKKLKLGVMGSPVRQSRSPELFYKTFAGRSDVLDRFSYDLLEESTFEKAFERFRRDYYAVNVTIPFKELAYRVADEASPQSRAIGAANLLIHQDGRITAHNTDVLAVTEILNRWLREQNDLNYSPGLKVSVVGCGGAGKAAVAAALSVGASVTIINRTSGTAIQFINHLQTPNSHPGCSSTGSSNSAPKHSPKHSSRYISDSYSGPSVRYAPLSDLPTEVRRADFIIYTLPLAITELDQCDFSEKTVLEAKYYDPSIKQTPGMTYIPGTEWLRLQAMATYRILGLVHSVIPDLELRF